jgi:hypothetical protein
LGEFGDALGIVGKPSLSRIYEGDLENLKLNVNMFLSLKIQNMV